jgi:histidyl-tRNA synthetase
MSSGLSLVNTAILSTVLRFLELSNLYHSKSSDEIVSEQTYIFKDRGSREVVMRPEMTPSLARMVARRRQELVQPVRWFSIPNLV